MFKPEPGGWRLAQPAVTNMKTKALILAASLFVAGSSAAFAYDITSDPDATMNQEQKLGPNVRAYRVWNKIYVFKGRTYYPSYAYYRYR
jgi:hypothetical protein